LGLEEDILVGKAVENPVITCWYPLHYKGISRGRGKLKLEFRCNIYLATNTVPRLAYDSGNFQSSKRSVSNSHILNRVMHRWSNRYMKLTVKLVAGKELPRMDRFGLCDPFVKIKITSIPPTCYNITFLRIAPALYDLSAFALQSTWIADSEMNLLEGTNRLYTSSPAHLIQKRTCGT
jgi:hypothetical protein